MYYTNVPHKTKESRETQPGRLVGMPPEKLLWKIIYQ